MINTRTFTLETLIFADKSVWRGPLDLYNLMQLIDFVSGTSNCGHQIPRAMEQIKPFLRKQLPFLEDVPDMDRVENREQFEIYFADQITRFGSSHEVKSMPEGMYDSWDAQHAQAELEQEEARKEMEERMGGGDMIQLPDGSSIKVNFSVEDILRAGHHDRHE